MISLLLFKATGPVTSIYNRAPFFLAVFLAMTAFGTVEQLVIVKHRKKSVEKKETKKDKQQPDEPSGDWRTR
jgi:hypothetical protein